MHPENGDNVLDYDTQIVEGRLALKWKDNGDCIYLGEKGCTIWPRRPAVCKEFDCREIFSWPKAAQKFCSDEVKQAARNLLRKDGKI